jgi:hypothetical protein
MNTDKLTTILGGLYGLDQLQSAITQFLSSPSVESLIHVVAACAVVGWAYFTNRQV